MNVSNYYYMIWFSRIENFVLGILTEENPKIVWVRQLKYKYGHHTRSQTLSARNDLKSSKLFVSTTECIA